LKKPQNIEKKERVEKERGKEKGKLKIEKNRRKYKLKLWPKKNENLMSSDGIFRSNC
jgi:hypothetical protein